MLCAMEVVRSWDTDDRISLRFLRSLAGEEHFASVWCSDLGGEWEWPVWLVWKQQELDLCASVGELADLSEPDLSNGAKDTYIVLPQGWDGLRRTSGPVIAIQGVLRLTKAAGTIM